MGDLGQIEFHRFRACHGTPTDISNQELFRQTAQRGQIGRWDERLAGSHLVEPAAGRIRAAQSHPQGVQPAGCAPVEEVPIGVAWNHLHGLGSQQRDRFRRWVGRKWGRENIASNDDQIRRMLFDRSQRCPEGADIPFEIGNKGIRSPVIQCDPTRVRPTCGRTTVVQGAAKH